MKVIKQIVTHITLLVVLVFSIEQAFARSELLEVSELKIGNIGDFKTTNGGVIKDCKVAYRTLGSLNADQSNAVLWPTWFTGTSEDLLTNGILTKTIDTTGLYIVIVDALANGISSSPSNTADFPDISIGDMVNSQQKLLVEQLGIDHLYAIVGISMGGMQTFEWLVSYPQFMDKAIAIIGTPKQSSFDVLVWQTQIDLITHAGSDKTDLNFALKKAYDIFYMNLTTPTNFALTQSPNGVQAYMAKKYKTMMDAGDYLASMKAMIQHDIYKSADREIKNIKRLIKADVLTIVSSSDHLVNPLSAMALSKVLNSKQLVLTGNNGHMAAFIQTDEIFAATSSFLK